MQTYSQNWNGSYYAEQPPPAARPRWMPLLLLSVLLASLPAAVCGWLYFCGKLTASSPTTATVQPREVATRGELGTDEQATIDQFKAVSSSVVHVTNVTVRQDPYSLRVREVPRGSGTGFVWDTDGFIVTNYHVVDGANKVQVILADHSKYESGQIWGYPDMDLAVIRINAPKQKLKPIDLGTSRDLQVGQKTLAIGNPFGLDQTLTTGVVSALDREIESANGKPIQGVIQTSAAINPGNSGGPLLDSAGRLIGVNTAILSPSGASAGIGFAIPVDAVNRVVPQLIAQSHREWSQSGIPIVQNESK